MKKNKKQRGFTIIDVLTSFTIFSLVIVPLFYLMRDYLSYSVDVRNRIVAYNLSLEALEILRNIRDSNHVRYYKENSDIETSDWLLNFATSSCSINLPALDFKFCDVDYASKEVLTFPITLLSSTTPLNFDATTHLFSHQAGSATPFTRQIYYRNFDNESIQVVVRVDFPRRFGTKTPIIYESDAFLYNTL